MTNSGKEILNKAYQQGWLSGFDFSFLENSSSCPHCHCRLYDADESDKNAVRRSSEYWKAKCKLLELEREK